MTDYARHYPTPAAIEALAAALVEADPDCFTGEGLSEAFNDYYRDAALVYEGDRHTAIVDAWVALGLHADTEEGEIDAEEADPAGWRMWVRFTTTEAALFLLTERQAAWNRAAHALDSCWGAYPMPVETVYDANVLSSKSRAERANPQPEA